MGGEQEGGEEGGGHIEQAAGGGGQGEEQQGADHGGGERGGRVQPSPLPPPLPRQQVGDGAGHRAGGDHLHPLAASPPTGWATEAVRDRTFAENHLPSSFVSPQLTLLLCPQPQALQIFSRPVPCFSRLNSATIR